MKGHSGWQLCKPLCSIPEAAAWSAWVLAELPPSLYMRKEPWCFRVWTPWPCLFLQCNLAST